jgi:predicted MFS family arabinose efflux permease
VEPHRVGIANSLFFNSMDAGMAIGAYFLGIAANFAGYGSIYVLGVVLIAVTAFLYFALTGKKKYRHLNTSTILFKYKYTLL